MNTFTYVPTLDSFEALAIQEELRFRSMPKDKKFKHLDVFARKSNFRGFNCKGEMAKSCWQKVFLCMGHTAFLIKHSHDSRG